MISLMKNVMVKKVLEQVELSKSISINSHQKGFLGGEQQRVSIARAIAETSCNAIV